MRKTLAVLLGLIGGVCFAQQPVPVAVIPTGNINQGVTFNSYQQGTPVLGPASVVATVAAPGTLRGTVASATTSATTFTSGNLVGSRGDVTVPSITTVSGGYLYGNQGKSILAGTINGNAWIFGLVGQLDASQATLTASAHVAPIWSDAGATSPAVSCAFCDGMVITNTTATTYNSLIYGYSKAVRLMDLTDNGGGYIIPGSGSSAAVAGYLKIKVSGTDVYLRYYAGAS
jgi:hypothetical protein